MPGPSIIHDVQRRNDTSGGADGGAVEKSMYSGATEETTPRVRRVTAGRRWIES